MKKITAFFLLLLPLFITALMFLSGLIQNINFPVNVSGITIYESDQDVKWTQSDSTPTTTCRFHAQVLPLNAKNQDIIWTISDDTIGSINDEGLVTLKNYGKVMVTATAAGNTSCSVSREIDSFDTIIHNATISNGYDIGYLSKDQMAKPALLTSPTIDHAENVKVTYQAADDVSKDYIDVDENTGIITAKKETTNDVTVKVKTTIESSSMDHPEGKTTFAEAPIKIGPAIDIITLDDITDQTITDNNYNLFDHLVFGPAIKKTETTPNGTIEASDFIYESENPDIATIENYDSKTKNPGKVDFLKTNEFATITATYRRNPDIKVSKKIQSTDSSLKQVFFNQSSLTMNYVEDGVIPQTKPVDPLSSEWLTWYTYPEQSKTSFLKPTITSTNTDVVAVVDSNDEQGYKLVMKNPGKCALLISVGDEGNIKTDVCEITLTLPTDETKIVKESKVTITNGSHYYPLRNNIKLSQTSTDPQTITYDLTDAGETEAYIDDNNILHFKKPGTVTITVNAESHIAHSFEAVLPETQAIEKDVADFINIEVGQKIKIKSQEPVFEGKYYQDYFDLTDDGAFIANRGCDISDFELKSGKKIHLTVKEDPLYIAADESVVYSTPEEQVDFLNTFNPRVIPETATKSDGSSYQPIFKYTFDNQSTGTIDENVINFAQIGTCKVKVSFGIVNDEEESLSTTYLVRCTYHDQIGKFKVTTNDTLPLSRTTMTQYSPWVQNEDGSYQTLRIDGVSYSLYENVKINSKAGLCNPTIDWVGSHLPLPLIPGHIELNANPISGKFGDDIIEIASPTYSLFLKISIKPIVTDFAVSYQEIPWGKDAVTTYKDSIEVRVTPNTIGFGEDVSKDWKWSLQKAGEEPTASPNKAKGSTTITLDTKTDQEYVLYLFNNKGEAIKAYNINKKPLSQVKVSLYNSEDGVYASCNSNTKSALIVTDGYVDNKFYKGFKDNTKLNDGGFKSDDLTFNATGNILTISNIKEDTNGGTLTLSRDGTTSKTYPVGRDQVSKIKLPGHNILDQSDKKGMQKVHVYGNYSFYPGEGEVNYYKVPVVLYNKARKVIENTSSQPNLKYNILNNLKITIGRNSAYEIDKSGDFIKVIFNKNDLYTRDEIYNNAFDTKSGKNIDFQVATKSNEVHADYKFVAVEGTNVWTQEPMALLNDQKLKANAAVLQKNFGLSLTEDENNAVLTGTNREEIFHMYGNGYAYNLQYVSRDRVKIDKYTVPRLYTCINVDICGADNETLVSRKEKIHLRASDDKDFNENRYYAYSIIHNFTDGVTSECTKPLYFKNSILHSSLNSSIFLNSFDGGINTPVYIEDCSFFNSASFPIVCFGPCPIYFKGKVGIYNFQDKEMLRRVGGEVDLTAFWPMVLDFARRNNMTHRDFKNDEVINSFMIAALNPETYFYDTLSGQYIKGYKGTPGGAQYLARYIDITMPLPVVGRVGANLWGGVNPSIEPGAPSYYDEYDENGKLKMTFISTQINLFTRHPKYF